jgi:hypothetical protein
MIAKSVLPSLKEKVIFLNNEIDKYNMFLNPEPYQTKFIASMKELITMKNLFHDYSSKSHIEDYSNLSKSNIID